MPLANDIAGLLDDYVNRDSSNLLRGVMRCKRMARAIKVRGSLHALTSLSFYLLKAVPRGRQQVKS